MAPCRRSIGGRVSRAPRELPQGERVPVRIGLERRLEILPSRIRIAECALDHARVVEQHGVPGAEREGMRASPRGPRYLDPSDGAPTPGGHSRRCLCAYEALPPPWPALAGSRDRDREEETPGSVKGSGLPQDRQRHGAVVLVCLRCVPHRGVRIVKKTERRRIEGSSDCLLPIVRRLAPVAADRREPCPRREKARVTGCDRESRLELVLCFSQMPVPQGEITESQVKPGELLLGHPVAPFRLVPSLHARGDAPPRASRAARPSAPIAARYRDRSGT